MIQLPPGRIWLAALLAVTFFVVLTNGQALLDELVPADGHTLANDIHFQDVMRTLRRIKRAQKYQSQPVVVVTKNDTASKCVISADQAVHFCGTTIDEVHKAPIPPPEAGQCHTSPSSGREICYPRYEDLDTTCTDKDKNGVTVSPPKIPHADVRAMGYIPKKNVEILIRKYYRQMGKHLPKNWTISVNNFLFARYQCEAGYDFIDEVDMMFCQDSQWVQTQPVCRGQGVCSHNNGGCSHSCLSYENGTLECRCPKGMVLDSDQKTCIKPIPKNLCRTLAGCSCNLITGNQYACNCPHEEQCLLQKGPPKIYIQPAPPYTVQPGGNINLTCSAVAYPFPEIYWERDNGTEQPRSGHIKFEQVLMVKEIHRSHDYVCHASNAMGTTQRKISVIVAGPGSAPHIRNVSPERTTLNVSWSEPHILNRPITHYTIYYTNNDVLPIKNWKQLTVEGDSFCKE
jgi:hypothetical protein